MSTRVVIIEAHRAEKANSQTIKLIKVAKLTL